MADFALQAIVRVGASDAIDRASLADEASGAAHGTGSTRRLEVVTVGDMFDDAGLLAERALFRAPAPGTTGIVSLDAIRSAALRAGLIDELTGGQPLQIWRVSIRERPFYLVGFGAPTNMPFEVQEAFDRIFARPTPRVMN